MPLPIAHSVISASVYAVYNGGLSIKKDFRMLGFFMFTGLFPDIDFITVPFAGFGSHRGFTHSFAFALIMTAIFYLLIRLWKNGAPLRLWAYLFSAMALHPVCDFFTYDYLVERGGVMLFYPFSNDYFEAPFSIFMGIELRYLKTILSLHTLLAIAYETVLSVTLLAAVLYLRTGSVNLFGKRRRAQG